MALLKFTGPYQFHRRLYRVTPLPIVTFCQFKMELKMNLARTKYLPTEISSTVTLGTFWFIRRNASFRVYRMDKLVRPTFHLCTKIYKIHTLLCCVCDVC